MKHSLKIDLLKIFTLFILCIIAVYYSNAAVNRIFFIFLLIMYYKSKNDYLWYALFFILISTPGGIFVGSLKEDVHRIPFYNITLGISFSFFDLFLIVALIKAFVKGRKPQQFLKLPFRILIIYGIFLLIVSFLFGTSTSTLINFLRDMMIYTLFISFPYNVKENDEYKRFILLVFPFVFLVLADQFYQIVFSKGIINLLDSTKGLKVELFEGAVRAYTKGGLLVFFSLIFSLNFLSKNNIKTNKKYLFTVLLLSILSVFLSATRGWIIIISIMIITYYIFVEKINVKVSFIVIITIVCVILFYLSSDAFRKAADLSIKRLDTVNLIIEGDITAGGTLGRFDLRLPRVLEGFQISPIFGLGFSDLFAYYCDDHVGIFNLLLQTGIIGFFLFVGFWISYYKLIFRTINNLPKGSFFRKPLQVLLISMTCMLILQFTSLTLFRYASEEWLSAFIVLYLIISQFMVNNAVTSEKLYVLSYRKK